MEGINTSKFCARQRKIKDILIFSCTVTRSILSFISLAEQFRNLSKIHSEHSIRSPLPTKSVQKQNDLSGSSDIFHCNIINKHYTTVLLPNQTCQEFLTFHLYTSNALPIAIFHSFHDFDISRKNIRLADIHVDFCINVQMCKYK